MGFGFITGAVLTVSAAVTAMFAPQDFTITNSTGHTIVTLNVSPTASNQWGPDILGRDVLPTGEQAEISFDRDEDHCMWDVRATYDDGTANDLRRVNLCELSELEFTPSE